MEESNNKIDISQIEKIVSVVKLVQTMNNNALMQDENEEPSDIIKYDNSVLAIQKIKDVLPHIEQPYQRNIGIIIKVMEIHKLINTFQAMSFGESVDGKNNIINKKRMLLAIKPELDIKKQKILDMLIKLMEITDIMEGLNLGE